MTHPAPDPITKAAVEAHDRGFCPVPVKDKKPALRGWTEVSWSDASNVESVFSTAVERGATGLGLVQGTPSSRLVSVDLDDLRVRRLADELHWLPETQMLTGRASNRWSQRWYIATGNDPIPRVKRFKGLDGQVLIEFRGEGGQTLIPPSTHPSGESYRWEHEEWGDPAHVDVNGLAGLVALIAMLSVLAEAWPRGPGSGRHDACLALAGGLCRSTEGIDPFWSRHATDVVEALANFTQDEESVLRRLDVETTLRRIEKNKRAQGWPTLAKLIGDEPVRMARSYAREVMLLTTGRWVREELGADHVAPVVPLHPTPSTPTLPEAAGPAPEPGAHHPTPTPAPSVEGSAAALFGGVGGTEFLDLALNAPKVLPWWQREDGAGLLGPGMLVKVWGKPEACKSLLTMGAMAEAVRAGGVGVLVELDAGPVSTARKGSALMRGMGAIEQIDAFTMLLSHDLLPCDDGDTLAEWINAFRSLRQTSPHAPMIVAVDTVTQLARRWRAKGLDLSTSTDTDIAALYDPWKRLAQQAEVCVVLLDHQSIKSDGDQGPMGSTTKMGEIDVGIRLDVERSPTPTKQGVVSVRVPKDRDGVIRDLSVPGSHEFAEAFINPVEGGGNQIEMKVPPLAPRLVDGQVTEPPDPTEGGALVVEITDKAATIAEQKANRSKTTGVADGVVRATVLNALGRGALTTSALEEKVRDRVQVSTTDLRKVRDALVAEERIVKNKRGRTVEYRLSEKDS